MSADEIREFFRQRSMIMDGAEVIRIINASENNLDSVSLDIPKNKFVVVTGVSGSGKSSLIFDVLYREAEFRYFGSFSAYARMFLGKMKRPEVERIEGLSPAVAVDQGSAVNNPRSTVGTISGIHDHLRLLFARTGVREKSLDTFHISRSLFSFNTPEGACAQCKGLGVEDRLDPDLLVEDATKSIRQRAMSITTPNGYIMYSQVTLDVLDQVCRAEGFNIDIPWQDLTPENKQVIFYGSDKIEIPFGKHPLESRMKWSGITAKPREMGVYKGIIPVMEEILKRDRNKNILRFVRTTSCSACGGKRFNENALSVKVGGWDIAALSALPVSRMAAVLGEIVFDESHRETAEEIIHSVSSLVNEMQQLGLGHLSSGRESGSLSAGESRRLKLATQLGSGLSGMIYVFDEPSVGLHDTETLALISVLKRLRDQGNSVIVVEHDEEFIRHADHIVDIGPGPGVFGGRVLVNCTVSELAGLTEDVIRSSKTLSYYFGRQSVAAPAFDAAGKEELRISGASHHNLQNLDVSFLLQSLNVMTGVSGAGKASLVHQTLGSFLRNRLQGSNEEIGRHRAIEGWEGISRIIEIDQGPIGKTPRSNPATYTGLFDHIRKLFAESAQSEGRHDVTASTFSFNTAGGRCEDCLGAGYKQTGMHFMGNVETVCESCNGRRFDNETLEVLWNGKNISEVLAMPVTEALEFFAGEKKILQYLQTLDELGLGYLTLGQRSSTLSGGEAQRIRLAAELMRNAGCRMQDAGSGMRDPASRILHPASLYILDEPTTGLHADDVNKLLACLKGLTVKGHTIICIEHHHALLRSAGRIIKLGPGSGEEGGKLVFSGTAEEYFQDAGCGMQDARPSNPVAQSPSNPVTQSPSNPEPSNPVTQAPSHPVTQVPPHPASRIPHLSLSTVTTHNLKGINVSIPHGKLTVITGVSGSGKSSLAFDTIHAEARNRFLGNFSAYARSQIGMKDRPDFESVSGLRPTFAVEQSGVQSNPRSTVGTYTGIHDLLRLLFSRSAIQGTHFVHRTSSILHPASCILHRPLSTAFSFNSIQGACPACDGLGMQTLCDPEKLITNPEKSVLNGAMDGTKTGKFYGDPYGQYVATLKAVGAKHGIEYSLPWNELTHEAKQLALQGCGDETYDVSWEFLRNKRSGTHHFRGKWQGLLQLVQEEYQRKHADHRAEGMMNVMSSLECAVCSGKRLNEEALSWVIRQKNIAEISAMSVSAGMEFFGGTAAFADDGIAAPLVSEIMRRLEMLSALGLSYLSLSRSVGSLSRGEARRLQLAAQTGSGLSGMIYVLDEPTAGLHPRDVSRLIGHMRKLIAEGNTLIAVEHDKEVILSADHIIDMGPGAGSFGGRIVAEGSVQAIMSSRDSVTGPYLGDSQSRSTKGLRALSSGIRIKNAYIHNLKHFDLEIPSGGIICVTGVSGSGKSSLVFDLIQASWQQGRAVGCGSIEGFEKFSRLVSVEQREEFGSPLAVVATWSGAFDLVRNFFAATESAKALGFGKNHFSFLGKQSQCPQCEGMGRTKVSMDFMPDVYRECELCLGKRYIQAILEVKYNDRDISEVLDLSVSEAAECFKGNKNLYSILMQLETAGLGYLKLGQPLNTLSGGESQRLNLCRELSNHPSSAIRHPSSLYLFDEPSTGLHFKDIENLLKLFNGLADAGNTLLIIEHDPQIIAEADHVIELGPEGGEKGGYLIKG